MMTQPQRRLDIPLKRSKRFIKGRHNEQLVLQIMEKYLDRMNVPRGKEEKFLKMYWELMMEKVKSGEVRIELPHNLGYLQVLEHLAANKKEIQNKFNGLDYSLIWQRHPMFFYHRIYQSKSIREEVRERRLKGTKYLSEYVDGDTYVY